MNIKNTALILLLIKTINCIKTEFVSYNSFNLILKTNAIDLSINNSFTFLIDTGSSYTWIPGSKNGKHNYYNITNLNEKPILENKKLSYYSGDNITFSLYNTSIYINDISIIKQNIKDIKNVMIYIMLIMKYIIFGILN